MADSTSHSPEDGELCECNKSCLVKHLCHMNVYWRCLILFGVVMIYLLLGGEIFSALERPNEMRQNEEAEASYNQTIGVVVDFLVDDSNFSREAAMNLVNNITMRTSDATAGENWLYASSVFFAVTVVTTVGYGTIAPVTGNGRIFFIIYAMIGIPLTLTFLAVLSVVIKNVMAWIVKKRFAKNFDNVWVQVGVFLGAGFPLFIFFPAIIFSAADGWSYGDSIYYCFVTLTTVGFGDFVPGIPDSRFNGIYRICTGAWIFVGLAFLFLVISLMQQVYEKFEKSCHRCVGHAMKDNFNLPSSTELDNSPEKPESFTEQN